MERKPDGSFTYYQPGTNNPEFKAAFEYYAERANEELAKTRAITMGQSYNQKKNKTRSINNSAYTEPDFGYNQGPTPEDHYGSIDVTLPDHWNHYQPPEIPDHNKWGQITRPYFPNPGGRITQPVEDPIPDDGFYGYPQPPYQRGLRNPVQMPDIGTFPRPPQFEYPAPVIGGPYHPEPPTHLQPFQNAQWTATQGGTDHNFNQMAPTNSGAGYRTINSGAFPVSHYNHVEYNQNSNAMGYGQMTPQTAKNTPWKDRDRDSEHPRIRDGRDRTDPEEISLHDGDQIRRILIGAGFVISVAALPFLSAAAIAALSIAVANKAEILAAGSIILKIARKMAQQEAIRRAKEEAEKIKDDVDNREGPPHHEMDLPPGYVD